ncbi:neurogenic locus notch homolog protein 1-like [Anneissia japonica]|uniref:neurogenic locus notch homolog protein 1-like n=1 Tax=Anneissia japonica TaxID=1529436 RepID=UPI001425A810|nr:neurogenic locus notch homolog protein 1-like [Anneissia japonica]
MTPSPGLLTVIFTFHLLAIFDGVGGQGVSTLCNDEFGNDFVNGQEAKVDCNTCTCLEPGWSCTEIACSDPCSSSPCLNGGMCFRKNDYYTCICPRNYNGSECQNIVPDDVCYDGERTLDNGETTFNDICQQMCECNDGVVTCDVTDSCPEPACTNPVYLPNNCCPVCWPPEEKDGFCPETSFSDIGTCEDTCQHDVNCTGDQKCCFNGCGLSCTDPQSEPTTLCDQSPCQNGGTCIDILSTVIMCQCSPGFHGKYCEIPDGKPCYYGDRWYRDGESERFQHCFDCVCNDGFFKCYDICAEKPGECPEGHDLNIDIYECDVDADCHGDEKCCTGACSQPQQRFISCEDEPCKNGGTCEGSYTLRPLLYTCHCADGYTGNNCNETVIDLCHVKPNPCSNGGNCTGNVGYPCVCVPGFHGKFCEDMCDPTTCQNGGTCTGRNIYPCICDYRYGGDFCEQDLCDPNPCQNGGTCTRSDMTCICPEGFSGDLCDEDDICIVEPCTNGGHCIANVDYSDDASPSYHLSSSSASSGADSHCQCRLGYKGRVCEIDLCSPNLCQNGGICTGFEWEPCYCLQGFTGDYCEEEEICNSQPCMNGGICLGNFNYTNVVGIDSYCLCLPGFIGDYCQIEVGQNMNTTATYPAPLMTDEDGESVTFDPTPCEPSPCLNGGTCEHIDYPYLAYHCECPSGFGGETCEEDITCIYNYCQNGGTCEMHKGQVYCYCTEDVTGQFCEYTPCSGRPCLNGGTCHPFYGDAYTCLCPPGTSGDNCQIIDPDVCANSPCKNFGSCSEFGNAADCSCVPGFTGRFCEIVIEEYNCPNGTSPDTCLFDPCHVASCPTNPDARCESNYCGCIAEFYDADGNMVNCHNCEDGDVVTCVIDPCTVMSCDKHPTAKCQVNYCGECKAEFYYDQGNKLDCEIVPCQYEGRNYDEHDQRDHEDACNICTCLENGTWHCTDNTCSGYNPDGTEIGMGFGLDFEFNRIENNLNKFKSEIKSQLASNFEIPENNIQDIQLTEGSVIVRFKLVDDDNIDAEAEADKMFEELDSGNVKFEFDGEIICVINGSVLQPVKPIPIPTTETHTGNGNDLQLVIIIAGVSAVVVVIFIVVIYCACSKRRKKSEDQNTTNLATISGNIYDNEPDATIQGSDNAAYVDMESMNV